MAILVGVMAPQLIKYIEKSKESADMQLCDTVRTAVQTAMLDPDVIQDTSATVPAAGTSGSPESLGSGSFQDAVKDALGMDPSTVADQLKSTRARDVGSITVYIGGSGDYANLVSVIIDEEIGCGPEFVKGTGYVQAN